MTDDHVDDITACIPALAQYALVVRLTVSACATLGGFGVDEVDDLRLLANEVFNSLCTIGSGPIDIRMSPGPGVLAIEMSVARRTERTWAEADANLIETLANVLGAPAAFEAVGSRDTFRTTVRARHR